MALNSSAGEVVALDVGNKRIGVARASLAAGIASPLTTLNNDETVFGKIADLCNEHNATAVVVGLPRDMSGNDTAQTELTRQFVGQLTKAVNLPVKWQDEAATSLKAEDELKARRKPYAKADIDALAATFILEDYLISLERRGQGQ